MKTSEHVKVLLLSICDSLDVLKSYALNSVPRPTDNIEDFHKWRDSELAYVHIHTAAVIRCRQKPSFGSFFELKVMEEELRLKALQTKDKLKAWSNEVVAAAITLHNAQKKANDKKKADAVLSGQNKTMPALEPPTVTDTLIFHVWQKISSILDRGMSVPLPSQVFLLYCRDRHTLKKMERDNHWPYRSLKARKAKLKTFLAREFNGLTLEDFFVDYGIFSAAEKQLKAAYKARARFVSRRAMGECEIKDEDAN